MAKGEFYLKLNYKRTFFIGLAFLSIQSFWQLYDNIIPLMLQNTFGLGETLTGGIMAIDNVLALFLLPLFGAFSDKVDTRFGKRTPFIVVGTIISTIFMIFIPIANEQKSFILFLISLGIVLLSMGTYRSPAVALMPDLTPKPLRSKANAVINLMGAVGGIITLILIRVLVPAEINPNYTSLFISVAGLMAITVVILLLTIREKELSKEVIINDEEEIEDLGEGKEMPKDVQKSLRFLLASVFLWFFAYNAVTTAFSRYAVNVWGMVG